MKVLGLDGKTHNWNLTQHLEPGTCSDLHTKAYELLRSEYKTDKIIHEITLPGSDGLRADLFLPLRKLIVEVNGEQHEKFVRHYHKDIRGFVASQQRDSKKRQWCELNRIRLVEFNWNETVEEWRAKLWN